MMAEAEAMQGWVGCWAVVGGEGEERRIKYDIWAGSKGVEGQGSGVRSGGWRERERRQGFDESSQRALK